MMTDFSSEGIRVIDVLYRVSTRAQEKEGESLFNQRRAVEDEWAVPRGIIVRKRIEVAESGGSALRLRGAGFEFSRRLEYRDLIVGYQSGGEKPDAVCVDWSDRWSRNMLEFIGLVEAFRALKIRLLAIGDGVDLTDRRHQLVASIKSAVAQEQVRVTSDKVRENRRSRRERGRWQGGRLPDGYRNHVLECPGRTAISRTGPDGKTHATSVRSCSCPTDVLYRDPVREAVVLAIWERLMHSPRTWAGIAEEINEMGHRRRDGKPFFWTDLHRMGENPHYAGIMVSDRWAIPDEFKRHQPLSAQQLRPGDDAIFDPYVTEDEFWRVHRARYCGPRRFLQRARRGGNHELSGLLSCPGCAGPMTIFYTLSNKVCGSGAPRKAPRKRYFYARCVGKGNVDICPQKPTRFKLAGFSDRLIEHVSRITAMSDLAIVQALSLHRPKSPKKALQRERLRTETVLREADLTRRFLQQERAVGRLVDTDYQRDLFDLREKTEIAKRRLAEIDKSLQSPHAAMSFDRVRKSVSWLSEHWSQIQVAERAEGLRLVVCRVTFDRSNMPRILEYGAGLIEPGSLVRLSAV